MVKDLDKTVDDSIMAEIDKAYQLKKAGRWEEAEKHYLHSWELFPEPQHGWSVSQMTLTIIAKFYLEWKQYEKAKRWALEVFKCEVNPGNGMPYFFLGKIHYEAGETEEARKQFEKAFEVSGRRVFQGEDPKYFKFLKEKRK